MRPVYVLAITVIVVSTACSKHCFYCTANPNIHLRTENEARIYVEAIVAPVEHRSMHPYKRPFDVQLDSGRRVVHGHPDCTRCRGGGFNMKIEAEGGKVSDWIQGQ